MPKRSVPDADPGLRAAAAFRARFTDEEWGMLLILALEGEHRLVHQCGEVQALACAASAKFFAQFMALPIAGAAATLADFHHAMRETEPRLREAQAQLRALFVAQTPTRPGSA